MIRQLLLITWLTTVISLAPAAAVQVVCDRLDGRRVDGELIDIYLPRGPLGVQMTGVSAKP